ncbi:MAG: helix-hairpin-helix domain-containing protein [Candidatus Zipacnadales bacterium]
MIPGCRDNQQGIVLIVTLWVLTVLAILALSFAQTMQVEARAAANEMQRTRAYYAAYAGIQRAILAIKQDQTGYVSPLSEWAYLDSKEDGFPFPTDERYEVIVSDECAKIDLNSANQQLLEQLPQLTPELIDCILDWRDKDDDPRPLGAEIDYYSRLRPPRACANRPFLTLSELLLVKGMTKEAFYGSIVNRPVAVMAIGEESPEDEVLPLNKLLTLYGGLNDTDALGQERLNINTASEEELAEKTQGLLTEVDVAAIIAAREARGEFNSIGDLLQVDGITREKMRQIADLLTTRSAPASSTEEPNVEESPAPQGGEPTGPMIPLPGGGTNQPLPSEALDQLSQLPGGNEPAVPVPPLPVPEGPAPRPSEPEAGDTTASDLPTPDQYRAGIYNINTAPLEVLATIEGMTEQVAQAIIREREKAPFTTRGDLLNLPEVTNELFSQLVEKVDVRSSCLAITSVGSVEEGRVRVRLTAYLDLKQDEPAIIYVAEG